MYLWRLRASKGRRWGTAPNEAGHLRASPLSPALCNMHENEAACHWLQHADPGDELGETEGDLAPWLAVKRRGG